MKGTLCLIALSCLANTLIAQYVYTIKADSVKVTNCDSSELIIENHTQNVPGFLFNTGNGRTIFKRGAVKINDSLYLIGADTLKLQSGTWTQGGNTFGATGVLGTLDNNHLDLYTNNIPRARLTNSGNLLLGTTTDNGNALQVNGDGSFAGNLGIGTATITHTGNLIGTDAILFNHFISQYHNYLGYSPYISKLDNVLYNYPARFTNTTTYGTDGSMTIDIIIPPDEMAGNSGIIYPGGNMYFSFWDNGIPQSISVKMRSSPTPWYGTGNLWFGPFTSTTNLSTTGMGFFKVPIAGNNFIEEYVITITPPPGGGLNLQNVEYILDGDTEGLINPWPFVGKYGDEHMYNSLYFKQAGVDNVRITSGLYNSNYFLNNVLIGSNADNENGKLQVTGNITAIGNLGIGTTTPAVQLHTTGAVRFAGLTNDNTRTRVLVSDADGNLYYRDASSLVLNDGPSSSLAVNGTISAHRLQLSQTGWPDYVFAPDYRLPAPDSLERYIRQNGHLPGIASAAEVEKKGIDVGENESALLKKIEELTLYLLRQEKTMREQTEEIKKLKQKNEQFTDLNEQLQEMRKELTMLQSRLNK